MNTGLSIVFPTSLLLTVTRGSSPENTRSLSIMSQSFGYLLAAIAPVIFGLVFDITNNWNYALAIPLALSLVMAVNSFSAGAAKKI
jgi:CP family cyanate transporter-like MFS transporter